MMKGSKVLSLLARVFEMSLYITLHRLMGWNSDILEGLFFFGLREILVLLISEIGRLLLRTFRTILVTLLPIMS